MVALLSVVLFGFGALVIDVGALYAEKRELQNGADAGALAIGDACGEGACPTPTEALLKARTFAGANASDTRANVQNVCSNEPALRDGIAVTACAMPDAQLQSRLDALDAAGVRYVAVTTDTLTATEGAVMPPLLSGLFGNTGTDVGAVSIVAWGGNAGGSAGNIPLIISACEWEIWTNNGEEYAIPEPDAGTALSALPWSFQVEIKTHDPQEEVPTECRTGGGFNSEIPGGFGWLRVAATGQVSVEECVANSSSTGIVSSKQGESESCVDLVLAANLGSVLSIPIFSAEPYNEQGWKYQISGYARFFITGYSLSQKGRHLLLDELPENAPVPSDVPACIKTANEDCVTGFFLADADVETGIPTAPSFGGSAVVTLIY